MYHCGTHPVVVICIFLRWVVKYHIWWCPLNHVQRIWHFTAPPLREGKLGAQKTRPQWALWELWAFCIFGTVYFLYFIFVIYICILDMYCLFWVFVFLYICVFFHHFCGVHKIQLQCALVEHFVEWMVSLRSPKGAVGASEHYVQPGGALSLVPTMYSPQPGAITRKTLMEWNGCRWCRCHLGHLQHNCHTTKPYITLVVIFSPQSTFEGWIIHYSVSVLTSLADIHEPSVNTAAVSLPNGVTPRRHNPLIMMNGI